MAPSSTARAAVPAPVELEADIEALENWVAVIRRRRNEGKEMN